MPLLWGLLEIMRQFEHALPAGSAARWSFSTYEEQLKDGRFAMPHVVFMRHEPASAGPERSLVRLHEKQADDQAAWAAYLAVEEFIAGGVNRVAAWLHGSGSLGQHAELHEWFATVSGAGRPRPRTPDSGPQRSRQPEPVWHTQHVEAPQHDRAVPAANQYAFSAATTDPGGAQRPAPMPQRPQPPAVRTGGNGTGGRRRPPADPRTMSWNELPPAVGHADTADRLVQVLDHISERGVIEDPAERRAARQLLAHNDFWVRKLWKGLRPPEVRSAVRTTFRCAFRCAFGPELAEGGHTWEFLGNMNLPAQALHPIVEYAVDIDMHDQLAATLGRRWMREHGWPVDDWVPPPNLPPVVRPRQKGLLGRLDSWTGGSTGRVLLTGVLAGATAVLAVMTAAWSF